MAKTFAARVLALLALFLLALPAMAQPAVNPPIGWLPGKSGLAPPDADYFTLSTNSALTNERVLTFDVPQFAVSDNGAGNTYVVGLGPILSYWYGTGATTNQQALNAITNIAGRASGDIFYWNGTNFTRLPIGSASDILTVSAGLPAWAAPTSGAPSGAHYVTTQSDGTLTNEHVLGDGDGTTATVGAGTAVVDVDSTVIRTTGAQSMSGPKTLSGGPIVSGANSTGLVLRGSSFDTTILTDPAANQSVTIPAVGTSSFVMTAGNQTVGGVKTLSSSPVLSTNAITGSGGNTVSLFTSSDTVVGEATSNVLTNKELTSPSLTNNATGLTMKGSGSNTFVHTWSPGGTGQTLTWPDPNGNADVAYKSGACAAGGVAYGIGDNKFSVTSAGISGQYLASGGAGAPTWATLPASGVTTVTGNTTLTSASNPYEMVDTTSGTVTMTLPDAASNNGKAFFFKKIAAANTMTVTRAGSDTIDGSTSISSTINESVLGIVSDGTARWRIVKQALLPVVDGGSGQSAALTAGGVIYGTSTTAMASTANSATGQILQGVAGGTPIWIEAPQDAQGRLTLTTATPVTAADVTAATTVYFTPYKGNRISFYNGTKWVSQTFSEASVAVPASTNTMYDVFATTASSTTISLAAVAWTNDTTRATGLVLQDGQYVKSGATSSLYVGSFRTTGSSGQTEDSAARRFVWNMFNRVDRYLASKDTTDSWNYTTAAYRAYDNNTTDGTGQVSFIRGLDEDRMYAQAIGAFSNSNATVIFASVAIGLDSSTAKATDCIAAGGGSASTIGIVGATATYCGYPGLGKHTLNQMEYSTATGTCTWYGDNGGSIIQTGMKAHQLM